MLSWGIYIVVDPADYQAFLKTLAESDRLSSIQVFGICREIYGKEKRNDKPGGAKFCRGKTSR
jgi:hypothetical protein